MGVRRRDASGRRARASGPTGGSGSAPRAAVLLVAGAAAFLLPASAPDAGGALRAQEPDSLQRRIDESQDRLEQLRAEQERLRQEMQRLSNRVSTEREELRNLEEQIGSSASVIAELDIQIRTVRQEVDETTEEMIRTRDRLTVRKAELRARLREVYKRGAVGPMKVLLTAQSFSDLINRYKYLHLVTLYDRMLVRDVSRLERQLQDQRSRLTMELDRLRSLREQKQQELADLERLERRRQRRIASYRGQISQFEQEMARLQKELATEREKLRVFLAERERMRREAERRAGRPSTATLRTSELGRLDWPVDGNVIYQFGPERKGNTTIQREGVGIGASRGAPVRAVEAGRVEWAGPRGVYGPSVIVNHGGGYYSVYLYLQNLRVDEGQAVSDGEVLGGVGSSGGASSPETPHIEFQIWEPSADGEPRAVDPVRWLRDRGGG